MGYSRVVDQHRWRRLRQDFGNHFVNVLVRAEVDPVVGQAWNYED